MEPSPHVSVRIDLARVRQNAEALARQTGVAVLAVVKADAYGLGAAAVAEAIADVVDAFYVFDLAEAVAANLHGRTGKRVIALHGASDDPEDYLSAGVQPVVWTPDRATALRRARPVLSLDTGQQRFACPPDEADAVRAAGECDEAMTHATRLEQVDQLRAAALGWRGPVRTLHAAGSALLGEPAAWLNAVRPGLALYRGTARVTTRLVEVRRSSGPAGYTGFCTPFFGVILAGYRNGLRPGPCRVNGRAARVLEVGMQSAFIELRATDRAGDEVVLLGPDDPASATTTRSDAVDEMALAAFWRTSPQEVIVRLSSSGLRTSG